MFLVRFSKQAERDKKNLKAAGLEKKTRGLLAILMENPFQNPPPYEALVGSLSGFYSRRINIQHRLVYSVSADKVSYCEKEYEGTVLVARMWTHYEGL